MAAKTKSKRTGREPIYPWDTWLKKGAVHTLKRGKDYKCTTRSMMIYLYMSAARYGQSLSVSLLDDNRIRITANGKRE